MKKYSFIPLSFLLLAFIMAACSQPGGSSKPPTSEAKFSLEPAQTTLELPAGTEASLWVEINREEGFDDEVKLSFGNEVEGITPSWSRNTANGDGTLQLVVEKAVPPGDYELILEGESDDLLDKLMVPGQTRGGVSSSLTIRIIPPLPGPNFTLSTQPAIVDLAEETQVEINIHRLGGFTGAVSLNVVDLPPGVSASFEPATTTGDSSNLTLTLTDDPPVGSHPIKVRGTTNGLFNRAQTDIQLVGPRLGIAVNPDVVETVAGGQASVEVTLERADRFRGQIGIGVQSPVDGITGTLSANRGRLILNVDDDVPAGSYTLTVVAGGSASGATGSSVPSASTTLRLTVKAFSIALSRDSIALVTDSVSRTETVTITLLRGAGFTEPIELTSEGLPAEALIEADFDPVIVTGNSSTLTLSADRNAPEGVYTLNLTATSTETPTLKREATLQVSALSTPTP